MIFKTVMSWFGATHLSDLYVTSSIAWWCVRSRGGDVLERAARKIRQSKRIIYSGRIRIASLMKHMLWEGPGGQKKNDGKHGTGKVELHAAGWCTILYRKTWNLPIPCDQKYHGESKFGHRNFCRQQNSKFLQQHRNCPNFQPDHYITTEIPFRSVFRSVRSFLKITVKYMYYKVPTNFICQWTIVNMLFLKNVFFLEKTVSSSHVIISTKKLILRLSTAGYGLATLELYLAIQRVTATG